MLVIVKFVQRLTKHNVGRWAFLFLATLGCTEPHGEVTRSERSAVRDGTFAPNLDAVVLVAQPAGTCTGVVVSNHVVLTARHCFLRASPEAPPCSSEPLGSSVDVQDVMLFSDAEVSGIAEPARALTFYFPTEQAFGCGDDLAALVLDEPVDAATRLTPARISPSTGQQLDIAGFGVDGPEDDGSRLIRRSRQATVLCQGGECERPDIAESEFALEGACLGDSGGPAFSAEQVLFGIASRSSASCNASVYTSVSRWHAWIADIVRDVEGDDAPTWANDESVRGNDEIMHCSLQRSAVRDTAKREPILAVFGLIVISFARRRSRRREGGHLSEASRSPQPQGGRIRKRSSSSTCLTERRHV
jgi:hypothetical protein